MKIFLSGIVALVLTTATPFLLSAGTTLSDRVAVEARVKAEIAKDLSQPVPAPEIYSGRICLDGRPADNFSGEVVEYWANLECPYCGIAEPLKAQRENANICIVARHIPAGYYGESYKKALIYEALGQFSINAANQYWDAVNPKTSLGIPFPYAGAMRTALDEAGISLEALPDALEKASALVKGDIQAAQGRITTTPTYIIEGIRLPACDFKADQIPQVMELAKKVRKGDEKARSEMISIITRGLMNEQLL